MWLVLHHWNNFTQDHCLDTQHLLQSSKSWLITIIIRPWTSYYISTNMWHKIVSVWVAPTTSEETLYLRLLLWMTVSEVTALTTIIVILRQEGTMILLFHSSYGFLILVTEIWIKGSNLHNFYKQNYASCVLNRVITFFYIFIKIMNRVAFSIYLLL